MRQAKNTKRKKSVLLPLTAGLMVALALMVVFFVPGGSERNRMEIAAGESAQTGTVAEIEGGNLVIFKDRLSSESISFIKLPGNSRIELLSRLGEDGTVKAALGTCQSCNGSPGAYYTQEDGELKCNNCGLTFPLSVLDSPGGGCHPIMLEEELMHYDGTALTIDLEGLSVYEELFSRVADH